MEAKSMEDLRDQIIEEIKKRNIQPVQVAYEARVSTATVYNFLNKKSINMKIINWWGKEFGL